MQQCTAHSKRRKRAAATGRSEARRCAGRMGRSRVRRLGTRTLCDHGLRSSAMCERRREVARLLHDCRALLQSELRIRPASPPCGPPAPLAAPAGLSAASDRRSSCRRGDATARCAKPAWSPVRISTMSLPSWFVSRGRFWPSGVASPPAGARTGSGRHDGRPRASIKVGRYAALQRCRRGLIASNHF